MINIVYCLLIHLILERGLRRRVKANKDPIKEVTLNVVSLFILVFVLPSLLVSGDFATLNFFPSLILYHVFVVDREVRRVGYVA